MKIHFSYQNATEDCKEQLQNYVTSEKLQSLTRLLQHGNFDLADLEVRVESLAHGNGFSIKLNLKIAKGPFYSEVDGYNLTEVFDLALGKIVEQVRKLENLRHNK